MDRCLKKKKKPISKQTKIETLVNKVVGACNPNVGAEGGRVLWIWSNLGGISALDLESWAQMFVFVMFTCQLPQGRTKAFDVSIFVCDSCLVLSCLFINKTQVAHSLCRFHDVLQLKRPCRFHDVLQLKKYINIKKKRLIVKNTRYHIKTIFILLDNNFIF